MTLAGGSTLTVNAKITLGGSVSLGFADGINSSCVVLGSIRMDIR